MEAHLRIKKIYMDKIAEGRKTVEWRSNLPHNSRRLKRADLTHLIFYYEATKRRVRAEVVKVSLVKRPANIDKTCVRTDPCWKIKLGKVEVYHVE